MSAISPTGFRQTFFLSLQAMHFDFLFFLHKTKSEKIMKKILLGLSFLAFQTTVCRAQIKNLFPEKNKIYLSDKAAAEYEKNQKLGEQFIK